MEEETRAMMDHCLGTGGREGGPCSPSSSGGGAPCPFSYILPSLTDWEEGGKREWVAPG